MSYILICFGTRPEYIKVKSLIDNLNNIKTCFTGQHLDLLNDIQCDYKLDINNDLSSNRLNNIISSILNYNIFNNIKYVLVQGDTSSALAIALSAFNNKIKIIHLEAGLRSYDINNPFPEEINRQLISRLANIHFCPTEKNKNNLLIENINKNIFVVGNTGLDNINSNNIEYNNIILITMHRRENLCNIKQWFQHFEILASKYRKYKFILPIHPNPDIHKHKHILKNINIIEPLNHDDLINILKKGKLVITDSGGLQEEASYLKKKIIVCRKTTERDEIINTFSYLCYEPKMIFDMFNNIINNYTIDLPCPYGDGKSWEKIKVILENIDK
jgi:UDP-N-acetylglucosamine 2-epimerase (non-hydrolysing)